MKPRGTDSAKPRSKAWRQLLNIRIWRWRFVSTRHERTVGRNEPEGCQRTGGTMASYHFERVLFVVGEPNSGKSNQLRSMFRDVRLGTGGNIPTGRRLDEVYRLSNERSVYLRLTSPHEAGESLSKKRRKGNFLEKTARIID